MKCWVVWSVVAVLGLALPVQGASQKLKIVLVDSYHREYLWSQYTHEGFAKGLLKRDYLDNQTQADELLKNGTVESSKAIIRILWMDTKRKSSKAELTDATVQITEQIKQFQPDLLFLGDDNAANYIGNQFLDTKLPIVLWGINSTLAKYGLVDSDAHPGHNVTGVIEVNYFAKGLELVKQLVPSVKTFAVLSDDTESGRAHAKSAEYMAQQGRLPLQLVEIVTTENFDEWKRKALELQEKVDAFLVVSNSAKDAHGKYVPDEEVMRWYLEHIHKPDVARSRRLVTMGVLCTADGSGQMQGIEAVRIAHDILSGGMNPATYPAYTPGRGPLIVNRQRAQMLGIALTPEMGIEEFIDDAAALKGEARQAAVSKP